MINFYSYYNGNGLDKEEYDPFIRQLMGGGLEFCSLFDQLGNIKQSHDLTPIEHIIKRDPWYAYSYARHVKRERWEEAEPIIKTHPTYAYFYAINILQRRWLEAESAIIQEEYYWMKYCWEFGI